VPEIVNSGVDVEGDAVEGLHPSKRRRPDGSHTWTADEHQASDPLPTVSVEEVGAEREPPEQHELQPIQIIGERSIENGLEYEVIVQGTVWLQKSRLEKKLVTKYRAEQRLRAALRDPTRRSSRIITRCQ